MEIELVSNKMKSTQKQTSKGVKIKLTNIYIYIYIHTHTYISTHTYILNKKTYFQYFNTHKYFGCFT